MARSLCCALALLSLCLGVARADDNEGLGEKVFTAEMLRVTDVNPNAPSDALDRGHVYVHRKFGAILALRGAVPSATYGVHFCQALPALVCQAMGDVTTQADGDALKRFEFNLPGTAFSGTFVLTRENAWQFVSGFHIDAPSSATAVEVRLTGQIETLATNTLRLQTLALDIVVDGDTKYGGVNDFAGLATGMLVEIKGVTQPDGKILASSIELEGQEGEKKNHEENGHGHDDNK